MAERLYQTQGLIVARRETGEASQTLTVLTADLGLLRVHAQGLRQLSSRLRYQTQVGYQLRLDLIAGRQWRLVGAAITNEFAGLLRDREKLVAVTALYRLLERLIHGEEPHPELFWELEAAFCFLAEQKLGAAERRAFLLVAGLRVLYHLGYVASVGERAAFLPPAPWMSEWLVLPPAVLKATQRELAQSLQSSGL